MPRSRKRRRRSASPCATEKTKRENEKRRCRNKMCVKHASTESIPNLLVDCKNRMCVKHSANGSISAFENSSYSSSNGNNNNCCCSCCCNSPQRKRSKNTDDNKNRKSKSNSPKNRPKERPRKPRSRTSYIHRRREFGRKTENPCECRSRPKSFIGRILEFLGLRRRSMSSSTAKTRVCENKKNLGKNCGRTSSTASEDDYDGRNDNFKKHNNNNSGNQKACCSPSDRKTEFPISHGDSSSCHPNCKCPYCPIKLAGQLDLNDILVPEECGDMISDCIREVVCSEIESRLEGLEGHIVEEERQCWAKYIPKNKCPRCGAGQRCDLHGNS